jgi:hypothetical protein
VPKVGAGHIKLFKSAGHQVNKNENDNLILDLKNSKLNNQTYECLIIEETGDIAPRPIYDDVSYS